ncbi:cardiolipin synthase [Oscillospiraceae bacterium PP1C4]
MHKKKVHIKSVFSFLLSKIVIIGLLIVIQAMFLVIAIVSLADYFAAVYAVLEMLSIVIVIWLIGKEDNPSYKLAWVIPIMALPIFGGLFYLVLGNKKLPKQLAREIELAEKGGHRSYCGDEFCAEELEQQNRHLSTISSFITRTTGAPLCKSTQAEYFPVGERMWERMLEELPKAERFIFMEYFILEEGDMWEAIYKILKEKVAQGVDVRLMFDDMGSIMTLPHNFASRMRAQGIKCTAFNPFKPHLNSMMNYRDHRKITVIDGNVGFCGGINIADEYINGFVKHGHWKDTGVLLRGGGVWNLTSMFLSLWNFSTSMDIEFEQYKPTICCESDGFVQAFGDSPLDRINVSEETYMQIINRATRYVYITTPYLILDNEMVTSLQMAARSGVDIRIVTPHIPDKWFVHEVTQSYYQQLLNSGVKIYEYTPGFVHAKMYVSDDQVAVVGTANMDYRSFYLHFECGVCFYNAKIVADVKNDILKTIEMCEEVWHDYAKSVPVHRRIIRAFLRLFSPML